MNNAWIKKAGFCTGILLCGVSSYSLMHQIAEENAGKFIVDQNAGTIKLTDDQASLESVAGDITVQVKVTATSIWGTVPNNVVTLNVRVKQWAD